MEIKRTIFGAFGYVYEYRKQFAKALCIPVTIIVLLGIVGLQDNGWAMTMLLAFLSFLIYTVLAVTTHRIILLGPQSVSEWGIRIPRKREFIFLLYSIGIGFILMPLAFLSLIPAIGWVLGLVAMLYLIARLSLVFPAIAIDKTWSFSDSWRATKNHKVLMIIVVAIFPFIVAIPEQLLSYVPYADLSVNLLSALTMVLVVAVLSVAFQVITENRES